MPNIFKVGDTVKLINPEIHKLQGYQYFTNRKRLVGQLFKITAIGSIWRDPIHKGLDDDDKELIIHIVNNSTSETVLSSWIIKTSGNNDINFYGKYL